MPLFLVHSKLALFIRTLSHCSEFHSCGHPEVHFLLSRYFYKAFGEGTPIICRLKIEHLTDINKNKWDVFQHCFVVSDKNAVKVPIEHKIHGWGSSLAGPNSEVIFGGGYNHNIENE